MNNQSDMVSVIIPAYNHEKFISAAIESVLQQSYQNFELIIINDGSKDKTEDVIMRFKDSRIKYYSQKNSGAHFTINRGIKLASGRYFSILNSDDIYYQNKIEKCISVVENNQNVGMVCGLVDFIDDKGKPLNDKHFTAKWYNEAYQFYLKKKDLVHALFYRNFLMTSSNIFCPIEVINKCGDFKGLRYAHDLEFMVKVSSLFQTVIINAPVIKYRIHNSNTINENQYKVRLEVAWIFAQYLFQYSKIDVNHYIDYLNMAKMALIFDYSSILLQYRIQLSRCYSNEEADKIFDDIIKNEDNSIRKVILKIMKNEHE